MLQARSESVVIIGLSERNLELMRQGNPCLIRPGGPLRLPFELWIFTGKDELTMAAQLGKAGLIADQTAIYQDGRQDHIE